MRVDLKKQGSGLVFIDCVSNSGVWSPKLLISDSFLDDYELF